MARFFRSPTIRKLEVVKPPMRQLNIRCVCGDAFISGKQLTTHMKHNKHMSKVAYDNKHRRTDAGVD